MHRPRRPTSTAASMPSRPPAPLPARPCSGLPKSVTEDQVAQFFGTIGMIKIDKKTMKPKVTPPPLARSNAGPPPH